MYYDESRAFNQGGVKPGVFAAYVPPWHKDYLEFLELRDNKGDENQRARDLFTATWFPDIFWKRFEKSIVEQKEVMWSFFCSGECPELAETFGDEFETYYLKYEKEGKAKKQMSIQKLFIRYISIKVLETGTPYACSKDTANRCNMQSNIGMIYSSNLCTEIYEVAKTDLVYLNAMKEGRAIPKSNGEIANCNLASVCLNKFVTNGKFDHNKLFKVMRVVVRNLNSVIDITKYPNTETRNSNLKARPIAIGVQGFADLLADLGLSYEDKETKVLNREIFETMYYSAVYESHKLAMKHGPYHYFKGSPYEKGKLHFDFYDDTILSGRWDWDSLKKDIMKDGVRNSLLLACMPTASSAQLYGNTESFEPKTYNIYTRKVSSGTFTITNKQMQYELIKEGLWTKEIRKKILIDEGSIQHIDAIPEKIKRKYKTVWEIPQKCRIELAADAQRFVDQGLSFNLYLTNANPQLLASAWIYSWKLGLKTQSYYCRIRTKTKAQQFTIKPNKKVPVIPSKGKEDVGSDYESDLDIYEEPYDEYYDSDDDCVDTSKLNDYYEMINDSYDIVIYTKSDCIYCNKAKHLLNSYNMEYEEVSLDDVNVKNEFFVFLYRNLGNKDKIPTTVPQIYINGSRIGGYTELSKQINPKDDPSDDPKDDDQEDDLLKNIGNSEFESECLSCQA